MIRPLRPNAASESGSLSARDADAAGPPAASSPYDAAFWKAFLANSLVTVAMAVLYHYADFVTLLGGSELHLGWIVGIGMVGSLGMRLFVGTRIDSYGPRRVWLASLALLAAACFGHLLVTHYPQASVRDPVVVTLAAALRIAIFCAAAGVYASSMTFISGRAPVVRMAELLGMLGTSGFLGVILGSWLGDLLLGPHATNPGAVDRMFLAAGLLAVLAFVSAWWATLGNGTPGVRRTPPVWGLLRRYHPGRVLVMGVAMGFGLGLPTIFLRTFAAEKQIQRISLFFTVYAVSAIVTRVLGRRLPERIGLRPVVLLGLAMVILAQFLFLWVQTEWQLLVPAVTYGIGHAVLFPAGFAEGCSTFPPRYRGLGTSLMLATYDVGQLVGAPVAGLLIHCSESFHLPGYPTMFVGVAILLTVSTGIYATAPVRRHRRRALPGRAEPGHAGPGKRKQAGHRRLGPVRR